MVGVAGRSKGCLTCRQRKVKCDETKPTCMRCHKSKLVCKGYRTELRVVPIPSSSNRVPAILHEHYAGVSQNGPPPPDTGSPVITTPNMLPWLEELSINFLLRTFFRKRSSVWVDDHNKDWVEDCYLTDSDDVSRLAINCLAAGYFGRMKGNNDIAIHYSDKMYRKAVRVLALRLQDPERMWDHQNLAACLALFYFEFLVSTETGNWLQHAGGIAGFVEARGPERHQTHPEHGIFNFARRTILAHAVLRRKRTFLEQENWRTVPWLLHPDPAPPWRRLYEIQVFLPGLCQDVEDYSRVVLSAPQADHEPMRSELAGRIQEALSNLVRWRFDWERNTEHNTIERPIRSVRTVLSDIYRPQELEIVLWYSDILYGVEIMTYNYMLAHLIYLAVRVFEPYMLRRVLEDFPIAERPVAKGALLLPHEDLRLSEYTTEICRSLDYLIATAGVITHETLNILGALRTGFLLISLILGDRPKTAWLVQAMPRIGQHCGLSGARQLLVIAPHGTREFHEEVGEMRENGPQVAQIERGSNYSFFPLAHFGAIYPDDIM